MAAARGGPRMYWTLKAPSGATVSIQGTIHLGGDELYPFHERVTSALKNADVVLAELSPGSVDRAQGLILDRMAKSILPGRRSLLDMLPAADIATIESLMGRDAFARIASFQPWVAYTALDAYTAGSAGLDPARGVDVALYSVAEELGKPVSGLESAEFQLDMLTGPSLDVQLLLLRDSVREYREHPGLVSELYRAYLDDDRRAMDAIVRQSMERSQKFAPELGRFNDALFSERNAAWAERLADLAAAGDDVFLFAGAGHFLGKGSVIDLLVSRGFTLQR